MLMISEVGSVEHTSFISGKCEELIHLPCYHGYSDVLVLRISRMWHFTEVRKNTRPEALQETAMTPWYDHELWVIYFTYKMLLCRVEG